MNQTVKIIMYCNCQVKYLNVKIQDPYLPSVLLIFDVAGENGPYENIILISNFNKKN